MPGTSRLLNEAEDAELLVYDLPTRTHIAGSEQAYQNFSQKYPNLDRHTFLGSVATTVQTHSDILKAGFHHNPALGISIHVLRFSETCRRVYVCSMVEYSQIKPEEFELMDTYMHFSHVLYPSQQTPEAPLFN